MKKNARIVVTGSIVSPTVHVLLAILIFKYYSSQILLLYTNLIMENKR